MIKFLLPILLILVLTSPVSARVTPEDIVNSQIEAYTKKVSTYSPDNQQKLEELSQSVVKLNKQKTDELDYIMTQQAAILDEYERRTGERDSEAVKKARYWITYAHESVAYQAAKVYVYRLTSEKNLKSDATSLVRTFQTDLNSTRTKVINSQKTLQSVIKDE